jgi:AraC-like DNA-binding protein
MRSERRSTYTLARDDQDNPYQKAKQLFYSEGGKFWSRLTYDEKYRYILRIEGPCESHSERVEDTKRKAFALRQQGKSQSDIARQLNVHVSYISRLFATIEPDVRDKITTQHANGKKAIDIATEMGLGLREVNQAIKAALPGAVYQTKTEGTKTIHRQMLSDYRAGMTLDELSARYKYKDKNYLRMILRTLSKELDNEQG